MVDEFFKPKKARNNAILNRLGGFSPWEFALLQKGNREMEPRKYPNFMKMEPRRYTYRPEVAADTQEILERIQTFVKEKRPIGAVWEEGKPAPVPAQEVVKIINGEKEEDKEEVTARIIRPPLPSHPFDALVFYADDDELVLYDYEGELDEYPPVLDEIKFEDDHIQCYYKGDTDDIQVEEDDELDDKAEDEGGELVDDDEDERDTLPNIEPKVDTNPNNYW